MSLPQANQLADIIRSLIIEINPQAGQLLVNNQVNLFDVGAMDSISIVEFIQSFESRLHIVFNYTDFKAVYFQTVDAIVDLLVTKYC